VRDAVCKMELDERHVKESLVYREKNYYFCSVGCRAEFERHPEDYVQAVQPDDGVKNDV
jgi:YHS domain-containing protein